MLRLGDVACLCSIAFPRGSLVVDTSQNPDRQPWSRGLRRLCRTSRPYIYELDRGMHPLEGFRAFGWRIVNLQSVAPTAAWDLVGDSMALQTLAVSLQALISAAKNMNLVANIAGVTAPSWNCLRRCRRRLPCERQVVVQRGCGSAGKASGAQAARAWQQQPGTFACFALPRPRAWPPPPRPPGLAACEACNSTSDWLMDPHTLGSALALALVAAAACAATT